MDMCKFAFCEFHRPVRSFRSCSQLSKLNPCCSITNQNSHVIVTPIQIIAVENNLDCSQTIPPQQQIIPPGTGYIIQLADPLNATDVRPTLSVHSYHLYFHT